MKRAGIVTAGRKILIEAFGTDFLDTIVADNGKVLVNEDYLKILILEANKKLKRNKEKIERFYLLLDKKH